MQRTSSLARAYGLWWKQNYLLVSCLDITALDLMMLDCSVRNSVLLVPLPNFSSHLVTCGSLFCRLLIFESDHIYLVFRKNNNMKYGRLENIRNIAFFLLFSTSLRLRSNRNAGTAKHACCHAMLLTPGARIDHMEPDSERVSPGLPT